MLRDLLTTWENWSARNTLTRARENATADEARISTALGAMPVTGPLAALRDSAELVSLLTGWQWQAMYAARRDGVSWEQVASALGADVDQARADYGHVLDHQESVLGRDVDAYREVL